MNFSPVKDFMDRLTDWIIPGNSISICLNSEEVFAYQSGYADVESGEKMTPDKLFNIYSCSKPLTVTAALQLYEKGLFLPDDPLYAFIPAYEHMYLDNGEDDVVKMQTEGKVAPGKREKISKEAQLVYGVEYDSGGAGITTSVSDYSKFAACLACSGKAKNGERILSERTITLMKQDHLNPAQRKAYNGKARYSYGLGVQTLVDKAAGASLAPLGEFGWGGAAGASIYMDTENKLSCFYAHHMLNPQEHYCQPRLRNIMYSCLD